MTRRTPRALSLLFLALALAVSPRLAAAPLRIYDAPAAATAASLPAASARPSPGAPQDPPAAGPTRARLRPAIPPAPPEYLTEDLGWLKLVYHPSTRDRVRPLLQRAAGIRAELGALLGREALTSPVEVRIAAAPAELDRLSPVEVGSAVTAAAFGDLHLAVLSAASRLALDPPDLESTLRHELAHLALDEATAGAPIPRWLHEGFAVHAAGEHAATRAQTLSLASLRIRLVPLAEIEALLPTQGPETSIAYAQAADFARFLLQPERRPRFADFIDRARDGAPPEEALARAYGGPLAELELSWREDVARRYGFAPVLAGALLALVLLVAGALALQRLRLRRARRFSPRQKVRLHPELRARPSRITPTTSPIIAARGARARGDADGDLGVPKVEHDGRWWTLH